MTTVSDYSASDEAERPGCLNAEAGCEVDDQNSPSRNDGGSRFAPVSRIIDRCEARTEHLARSECCAA